VDTHDARTLRHAYYAAVSYVDAQVGKLLGALKHLNLDEKTLIVLWGDHGWHLGDHGIWGKHTLHERALRSPLLMHVPGMRKKGGKTDALIATIDLYPTLASLCEVPIPNGLDGHNLARTVRDPGRAGKTAVISHWRKSRSIRTPRWRLTRHRSQWAWDSDTAEIELYDHNKDPLETANVATTHPQVVKRLRKRLTHNDPQKQTAPKSPRQ
jgi:arylsulfatase A-like enzyme